MSYRASIRPNLVLPFHRWTTCGLRQLHTEFGPNIRTTSIPAGPLSFMFSHFTIQNFILQLERRPPPPLRGPLNKISNKYDTIFSFWGWTTKCPMKPYTKFGPDIQRTCHAIRILSLPVYNSTHHCAMSDRASIRPIVVVPFHRWTTYGPRQLHTEFGPNIRTTSIPAGPLSFMFSHFTIQNFILQLERRPPPPSRSTQ